MQPFPLRFRVISNRDMFPDPSRSDVSKSNSILITSTFFAWQCCKKKWFVFLTGRYKWMIQQQVWFLPFL